MINELNQLHDKAADNYRLGCRVPSQILDLADLNILSKFGVSPQFLYDAVDDLARYGEPDKAAFVELARMRAEYFQTNLGARPASRIVQESELPPKSAEFDGIAWLPRIICKAQCFLEGSLCDDIMYGCAGDRAFLKKFHTTLPAFLNTVHETSGSAVAVLRFLKGSASRG